MSVHPTLGQLSGAGAEKAPQISLFENASPAAPTAFTNPYIFSKCRAVELFDRPSDAVLELFEIASGFFPPTRIHGMGDYIQFVHDLFSHRH